MDRITLANNYHDNGFNCAQSVFAAFGDLTGIDEKTALKIAGGFGGGVKVGEICGAASGAVMVIGALYPHVTEKDMAEKKLVGDVTTEFLKRFKERFGSLPCRDLKLIKISPEMAPAAAAHGIDKHCAVLIAEAVAILEELLEELKK
ncbi:MAG: C_GCAxxG_C_C family protein [Oscillospiraceae bacterium]|nr:C_GCAxxG_C_C family protein [Oscillospiraceae bacterium]